jgi:5-methylcytosine-specific restriction protein A
VPNEPLRVCLEPGCPELVTSGRCARHQSARRRVERRHYSGQPTVNYGRRWRKSRALFLERNPFCSVCADEGKVTPANVVDHREPHRGDFELFWRESNWSALCESHHNQKTAREMRSRR